MLRTLSAMNQFLGTLLALIVLGLLIGGSVFAYREYYAEKWAAAKAQEELAQRKAEVAALSEELDSKRREVAQVQADLTETRQRNTALRSEVRRKDAEISQLEKDVEAKQEEIDRLDLAMKLLKVDHRVAEIEVLDQKGSADEGDLQTRFQFVELDPQGEPLEEPRVFTVEGDVVYLDAWVIKFSDELIEMGDPTRSTSICLFRRIFGESQRPSEGFQLDSVGSRPVAYSSGAKMSPLEERLWSRFWEYANNPEMAKESGVRAAHGEAPSVRLMPGKRYRVLLRASGGLTIAAEDAPADDSSAL